MGSGEHAPYPCEHDGTSRISGRQEGREGLQHGEVVGSGLGLRETPQCTGVAAVHCGVAQGDDEVVTFFAYAGCVGTG